MDFPGGRVVRICLPMQGTWVRSLVPEDSLCHRATKAHVPQLLSLCAATAEPVRLEPVRCVQLRKPVRLEPVLCAATAEPVRLEPVLCAATAEPVCLEPVLCNKRSQCCEKPAHHNEEQRPLHS